MKKIIHVDMDAFFAAVEMQLHPELATVPMAVGGSAEKRGVLCTANYLARQYGVRSAMPTAYALKLCPQLVVVKPNFRQYSEVSEIVFDIFQHYTHLVEPVSLDEAFLDVTESTFCQGSATLMAKEIRQRIRQATGLTASAGVAPNKLLAKLASDLKKPDALVTIPPEQVAVFIRRVPVEKIWGVGKVATQILHQLKIFTCEDLQTLSREKLIELFGKFGSTLYDFARGHDERMVETEYERKSLGTEETFAQDLNDYEQMKQQIIRMSLELIEALRDFPDKVIKTLQVKIKYHDFKQTSIERSLELGPESFQELFEERWSQDPRAVRLLGVGVKFEESFLGQLSLLT